MIRTETADQRRAFEEAGYLIVESALTTRQLDRFLELHDRIYAEETAAGRLAPAGGSSNRAGAMHTFGFLVRDPAYLELLDLPTTFPIVSDILGWNIYVYHCHIDQHPPLEGAEPPVWAWHQDGGRQNLEVEAEPTRPRLSLKVAYYLSDVSEPGRGNTLLVPGSHRSNLLPRSQTDGRPNQAPEGAIPLSVRPGTAVLFDRRLWHSRSDNTSAVTRKALFLAYTYRWVRPRDEMLIDWGREPYRSLSPIRRQLLGFGESALSFWGLGEEPPVKRYMRGRRTLDPALPAT